MKKFSVLIVSFFIVIQLFAQSKKQSTYHHLVSYKPYPVELDLSIKGNGLEGWIYINDNKGINETFQVTGTINPASQEVKLTNNVTENAIVFIGKYLNSSTLEGNLTLSDPKVTVKILFEEDYPVGSASIKTLEFSQKKDLFNMKGSPQASYEVLYPQLNEDILKSARDSISAVISNEYFGNESITKIPEKAIGEASVKFFQDYFDQNREGYNPSMGKGSFNWDKSVTFMVTRNSNNILSLGIRQYAFTGGAHGLQMTRFVNFDLISGGKINLGDIFTNEDIEVLHDSITTNLKRKYKIQATESLKNLGFFENEINISDNFTILRNGFLFWYNPYELAPYSFGNVQIFVSFEQVLHLINRTSSTRKFCDCIN